MRVFCDGIFSGALPVMALQAAVHPVWYVLGVLFSFLWCGGLCSAHGISPLARKSIILERSGAHFGESWGLMLAHFSLS